ncbi:ParA family protein [Photobacterium kishitanii]|uniref:ParA family protein n=1 Tax=Photobacterium kishitanii TaxID=318456 RepID=UPI002287585B|nr:ParA family protein [Photobacterium kishitanii]
MTPKKDEVITKISKNMDMILGDLDIIFDTGDVQIRVGKVKKFIEENNLKDEYDYILIDSPPTISLFTDAALLASDYYLVPVKIDQYSILGATSLISVVKNLEYNFTHKINQLGFIYTNTDENMTDKTRRIKDEFENIKENHHIDDDLYFFSSQFSYVRDLMVGVRGNIASNYTKSRNDINAICHELIERLDVLERSDESE